MWESQKLDCSATSGDPKRGHPAWRPDRCTAPGCRPRADKENFLGCFDVDEECRECGRPFDPETAMLCPECSAPGSPRKIINYVPGATKLAFEQAGLRDSDGEPGAHALVVYGAYQALGKGENGVSLVEIDRFFDLWGVDDPLERRLLAGWFLTLDGVLRHENERHLALIHENAKRESPN